MRILALRSAAAALVITTLGSGQNSQAGRETLSQGYLARDRGDLPAACELFLAARRNPDPLVAANASLNYAGIASSCTKQEPADIESSISKAYQFAADHGSINDSSLAKNNLAVRMLRAKQYADAFKLLHSINFEALASLKGADRPPPGEIGRYYANLGRAYQFLGEAGPALGAYSRALAEGAQWPELKNLVLSVAKSEIVRSPMSLVLAADLERVMHEVTESGGLAEAFGVLTELPAARDFLPLLDRLAFHTATGRPPDLVALKNLSPSIEKIRAELASLRSGTGTKAAASEPQFAAFYDTVCAQSCGDWKLETVLSAEPVRGDPLLPLLDWNARQALSAYLLRLAEAFADQQMWSLALNRSDLAWGVDPFNVPAAQQSAALLSSTLQDVDPEASRRKLRDRYKPERFAILLENSKGNRSIRGHLQSTDVKALMDLYTFLNLGGEVELRVTESLLGLRRSKLRIAAAESLPEPYVLLAEGYAKVDPKRAAGYYLSASREFELTGDSSKAEENLRNAIHLDAAVRDRAKLDGFVAGQNAVAATTPGTVSLPTQVRLWSIETTHLSSEVATADSTDGVFSLELPRTLRVGDRIGVTYGNGPMKTIAVGWRSWQPASGLLTTPLEGDSSIHGIAPENENSITVEVKLAAWCTGSDILGLHTDRYEVIVDPFTREFDVRLNRPLEVRDLVAVRSASGKTVFGDRNVGTYQGVQKTRFYFESGPSLSRPGSSIGAFASLRVDHAWKGYSPLMREMTGCPPRSRSWRSSGLQTIAASGIRPTSFATSPGVLQTVDAAILDAGVFAPFLPLFLQWRFDQRWNALALGPVLRGGVQWSLTSFGGSASAGQLAPYLAAGARVAQFDFTRGVEAAPYERVSLELVFGRWKRFAAAGSPVPNRAEVTLSSQIPRSPFTLEFVSNFGKGAPDNSISVGLLRTDMAQVWSALQTETSAIHDAVELSDFGNVRIHLLVGLVISTAVNFDASHDHVDGLLLGLQADKAWISSRQDRPRLVGINSYGIAENSKVSTQAIQEGAGRARLASVSRTGIAAEVGLYAPVKVKDWRYGPESFRLFAAPIGKAFLQTPRNENALAPEIRMGTPTLTNRYLTSTAYGLRLGLFRSLRPISAGPDASAVNEAPELNSYLDFAAGRFANFEDVGLAPSQGSASMGIVRDRPWRYSAEALVNIPRTFFIAGATLNVRMGGPRSLNGISLLAAPSDLKLFFGARVDMARFLHAALNSIY